MTQYHAGGGVTEIRVKGHPNASWSDWFDGMAITNLENGDALLCGPIADQICPGYFIHPLLECLAVTS